MLCYAHHRHSCLDSASALLEADSVCPKSVDPGLPVLAADWERFPPAAVGPGNVGVWVRSKGSGAGDSTGGVSTAYRMRALRRLAAGVPVRVSGGFLPGASQPAVGTHASIPSCSDAALPGQSIFHCSAGQARGAWPGHADESHCSTTGVGLGVKRRSGQRAPGEMRQLPRRVCQSAWS